MIYLIYYILLTPMALYSLYFVITALFVLKKSPKKVGHHQPKYKLAVLIAARNEEKVIKNLILSLKKQDYPKDLYDIFVIPNNCADNTEIIAEKAGAKIVHCRKKVKSKGEVLNYIFKQFRKKKIYDAYVIFDADNVVAKNFLTRMNDALCEGSEIVKGFRDSKNPEDNWISGSYSIFYWMQNIFFGKSRENIGASSNINGTGFMIKDAVFNEVEFNATTLTEDLEFTVACALKGKRITYVEDAIVYDEQPIYFKDSWHQRERWTTGVYQCLTKYGRQLFKTAIKNKSFACLDMVLFLIAPIIQILWFLLGTFLTVYELYDISLTSLIDYIISYRLLFLLLTYIGSIAIAIYVTKYSKKSVLGTISGIITFPLFITTWIPINITCLFRKNINWIQIKHSRNVELDILTK